jgi:uncharacterized protein YfkK (UPF0435 family)
MADIIYPIYSGKIISYAPLIQIYEQTEQIIVLIEKFNIVNIIKFNRDDLKNRQYQKLIYFTELIEHLKEYYPNIKDNDFELYKIIGLHGLAIDNSSAFQLLIALRSISTKKIYTVLYNYNDINKLNSYKVILELSNQYLILYNFYLKQQMFFNVEAIDELIEEELVLFYVNPDEKYSLGGYLIKGLEFILPKNIEQYKNDGYIPKNWNNIFCYPVNWYPSKSILYIPEDVNELKIEYSTPMVSVLFSNQNSQ